MAGAKTPRYRVGFDFASAEAAVDFWEDFVATNLAPEGNDFRDCELVIKDDLHDRNYKVTTFLIRNKDPNYGNGRPVIHPTLPPANAKARERHPGDPQPEPGKITSK
tara:strand:+ start:171 stop:491 length:321 start_codon:yes stop_codon:yes gene_type:complete